ncbi:MAG: helix-turn-helix domain-containing protein [Candidatus Thorarchaeota archaeon]
MPKIREYDEDDDDIEDLAFPFHERPMTLEEADAFINKYCSVEPSRKSIKEPDEIIRKIRPKDGIETNESKTLENQEESMDTRVSKDSPQEFQELDPEEIRKLHHDDAISIRGIARKLGVPRANIRKVFREHDLEILTPIDASRSIDVEEVRRLYFEEILSKTKIADSLETSIHSINAIFRRERWETRPTGRKKNIDSDEVERLYQEGVPRKEIAEKLGCSQTTIHKIFSKFELAPIRTHSHSGELDSTEVLKLYVEKGLPLTKVADKLGLKSTDRIVRVLKEHEVEIRPYPPALLPNDIQYEKVPNHLPPYETEEQFRVAMKIK